MLKIVERSLCSWNIPSQLESKSYEVRRTEFNFVPKYPSFLIRCPLNFIGQKIRHKRAFWSKKIGND